LAGTDKENPMGKDDRHTMELSRFISETLVGIVQGVEKARGEVKSLPIDAEICPTGLFFRGDSPAPFKPGRGFVQAVEFDVEVVVSTGQSGEVSAEGGLSVGVPALAWLSGGKLAGDLSGKRQRDRRRASRVTFTVPVLLPSEVHVWDEGSPAQSAEPGSEREAPGEPLDDGGP